MKACSKCETTKPFTDFYAKKRDGRPFYNSSCKACDNAAAAARAKERYASDPEFRAKMKAAQDRYRQTEKGAKAYRDAQRRYLASEAGRKQTQQSNRRQRLEDPARSAAYARTGQYARRHRVPCWADFEAIAAVYAEAKRLQDETGVPHQVDHIVPMRSPIVSGLHCAANLRAIPAAENALKSNLFWPNMPDNPLDVVRFFRLRGSGVRVAHATDIAWENDHLPVN